MVSALNDFSSLDDEALTDLQPTAQGHGKISKFPVPAFMPAPKLRWGYSVKHLPTLTDSKNR